MTALFWASVFLVVAISYCEKEPIVKIPNGKLRGKFNGNFYEFKSIPYAEPPVGKNRFEPPKPYTKKWKHCRDATKTPNNCMQWDYLLFQEDLLHGEEDCLYLNVFTPSICGDELYPVVVHIHGGGFMFGSSDLYGPGVLLKEKKFVLVNFNYRLGPLGFLSTADSEIPGNMGLKDQQLAMKWVKEYIKLFKGDPERITLTGFSDGGACVNFHLFAEKSEGLFHAAISHSGTAHSSWAQIHNPLKNTNKLAEYLGCPTCSTKKLKKCLKGKPAEDIVRAVKILQTFYYQPIAVFGPVVEPKSSKDPFINEEYIDFMINSKTTKVPWIISYSTEVGGCSSAYLLRKDENNVEIINNNFDEKWNELAPLMLFFYETVPKKKQSACAEELKHKYLCDEKFSVESYKKVQKMFTDQMFLNGIEDAIKFQRDCIDAPVYVYEYQRSSGSAGYGNVVSGNEDYDFEKPAEDIVRAVKILQIFYYQPLVVFGPVVEPKSSKDPFINEEYKDFMKNSKTTKVPWIISYPTEVGGCNSAYLLRKDENNVEIINNNFDEKWNKLAPLMLLFNETVPNEKHSACAEELKHKYLGDEKFSVNSYRKVQKMFTDQIFLNGIEDAIKFHRDNIDAPVYVYQYDKSPQFSLGNVVSGNADYDFGAVLGDDVYLIYESPFFPIKDFDDEEKKIAQYFINMYETFARDGTPVYRNVEIPQTEPNSNEIKLLVIRDVEDYEVVTVDKIVEPLDPAGSCVNQYTQ